MSNEESFEPHNVMVVYQNELPRDVIAALRLFPVEVSTVDIGGEEAVRAIDAYTDSVIIDRRITDLTGVGNIFARRGGQLVPVLVMHDERLGWDIHYLEFHKGRFDLIADGTTRNPAEIIHEFFEQLGVFS